MKKSVQFLLLFLMCISASWTWASDAPERTVLFNMGDYDSQYWRIPALVTAADNSLVAVVDKRGSSLGDLPNTISIMSRRSTDNGKNWSEPVVVAQGGNGKTYGDPAVVLDKKTGNLICMFVGDQGLWNATPYNRQGIYVSKSTDNGVSWSEPVAITDQVYANHSGWYAGFAGSGHGLCLKDGRLMFVLAIRATSATGVPLHNYAIYSDDGGDNWTLSTNAATTVGDEAKVVELEDGDILMSIRNPSKGNRIFCKSTDRGQTWGKAYFETELKDPACNGDIIRYSYSTDEGSEGKSRLLHSLPESTTTRENVTVYLSEDDGETWPIKKRLVDGYSAYSSLTVLPDGTIGALVEEGKWDSNLPGEDGFQLVFYRFTMDWLTSDVTEPPVVSEGTLQLNGTDRYMRIPSADDFNIAIGESYTVTCKVKMPFSGSSCRFVSKRSYTGTANSGTVGWEMWGDMNASTRFSTNLSPAGSPWGGKGNGTGVTFTENQWVHLTWVFDWNENTTNIYVDGVLGESKSLHADFQSKSLENNFDVLVGAGYSNSDGSASVPSFFMNGEMDDLRFYNKALTLDEIKADMDATVDGTTDGLVAAYDFTDISGVEVPDISGHGHTGTLVNFPNYSTLYTVTIAAPDPEQGTLKVMNGSTEVVSGTGIPENTRLTVVAEPADGYQLKEIRVNDVALERNVNIFTLTQETTVTAEFEEAVPAYCTYEGNSSHDQRYVRSITMNGGTSPFSVSVYSTTRQAIYVDKTDHVLEAYAGEEIQPVVNWAGEWMHGYLYIDYDKDYTFSYTLGSDDYPTADGELVSYTFYSPSDSQWGKNSKGETTENNSRLDDVPSFTLPESLAPGDYRVRLKIDWCHLDPCGHPDEIPNTLTGNGGNIVDFTLRIVERPATYTVTLPETVENGTLTVMNGSAALVPGANTVEENSELTITAEPAQGYRLESLTVNGSAFTSGDTYTVTGNTEIAVSFAEIPVVTHIITYSVKQGEGTITLSNLEGTETYQSGASLRADRPFKLTFEPATDYKIGKVMYGPTSFGAIMELTLDENNSYTMPVELFVGDYTFEAYFTYDPETGMAENDREVISARYANGVLHVEGVTEGEFELCIYNLTGKLVRTATETVVDVADLAKGCYLVKVTTTEAEKVVKFIKK
ncbi:exo-alpha-sialidase [Barnesiella intestinihominis]|uniref:exo-alpha-sialidase n=1 Tax=Barnesiella intestinihominis TaxID=487174 RepID=UPI0018978EC2|nr:exo-alpha-sialidase [Barnesiella intestinihominis]MDB0675231.1 exo-alpha-sialidase [Barnesiella intestinihominis]